MVYCPNPVCPEPENPGGAIFCQTCGSALTVGDRYRLQSLLGRGGFGRTFLATQLTTAPVGQNRPSRCVIKQIYLSPSSSDSSNAKFSAEAERLRRLGEHPQIPRLFEAIASEQGHFLVQEYAAGQNLQQQVEADGPWAEAQVRSLLDSLVGVLQYVHSLQIIHRDIKPANIVIARIPDNSADGRQAKLPMLVDFGAAKSIRHSDAKTVIGSAGYAAPEQSMGQATFASDVYGLGLTCLYLLTGLHPFDLYSAMEDRWVWQDYLPTPIESRFTQVLNRMVARSLQQRYESMDQVALGLQSSQNFLIKGSQDIIARAKKSVPRLESILSLESGTALKRLWSASQQRFSKAASPAVITRPQTWQQQHRLAPGIGLVRSLAVSANGQTFASGGIDGAVRLWSLSSGELVHTFARRLLTGSGHAAAVTALAFHPDGRALYSASEDGTMKEWDSARRCLLNTMPTSGWTPTDLLVTPEGTQLVSPNSDGQIVVWDIQTLLPSERLTQHQKRVTAAALSTRGDLLVSAGNDGTIKLWKRQQVEGKWRFRFAKSLAVATQTNISQSVIALAIQSFNHAAGYRVIASTANEVFWYSVDGHLEISAPITLYRSSYLITVIALSPSGYLGSNGYLAVGSEDRILTLWDIEGNDCVAKLAHDWGIEAIAFAPDSRTLITASSDEVISIWRREIG
ncbi:protein kinase domain [Synechococcus sp. PCC 7335]|uniref:serine/threonine-protein kinase n=1 Tax=Synechococcus sp. (strain ATCC 29403 / PCC 7335) TaxID=91464 RepID=UPI00017EE7C7|nr:serine/threonine-protein kinase [Synechococcus sp. PCC 7335]EDX87256.1 protein kinase domain [Synechococcus sp. PCC 7335]